MTEETKMKSVSKRCFAYSALFLTIAGMNLLLHDGWPIYLFAAAMSVSALVVFWFGWILRHPLNK